VSARPHFDESAQMNETLVIFDMDGTITRPFLDFDRIRDEIGLGPEPILESVLAMSGRARERADAILHRYELEAVEASELQPDAKEVLSAIRAAGIPMALMTRNSRMSASAVCKRHGLCFDLVRTREDGAFKPSPLPVLEICVAFEKDPRSTWVVGDFQYDILCGRAAGAKTVLLLEAQFERPPWADEAEYVVHSLAELPGLIGLTNWTSARS
jgi:HAD superfamily hydrolase (TIGR01549 family)